VRYIQRVQIYKLSRDVKTFPFPFNIKHTYTPFVAGLFCTLPLLQLIETSSWCRQLWSPQPLWRQLKMWVSDPVHRKSSSQIGPVPAPYLFPSVCPTYLCKHKLCKLHHQCRLAYNTVNLYRTFLKPIDICKTDILIAQKRSKQSKWVMWPTFVTSANVLCPRKSNFCCFYVWFVARTLYF